MEYLIEYFLPSKGLSQKLDLFELRKRKLYIGFCLVSLLAISAFTISHFIGGKFYAGLINIVGAVIFLGSLFFYKISGFYTVSTAAFLCGGMFVAGAQHYMAPNYMQSNLMWFPLIAVISYFLLPKKSSVSMMIVCTFFALASHLLGDAYPIKGDHFNEADGYMLNILSIVLSIFVGYIIGKFISNEEGKAISEVAEKNSELVEMSESNSSLLSILSHDLANHIQVAYGFGRRTQHYDIENENIRRCIHKMNVSLESMKNIVDEVRGYTATKSGKMEIRLSPVNIVEAIESSIANFERRAKLKNIKLNLSLDLAHDTEVFSEPIALTNSVFNNLISNAIKFSEADSHIDIFATDLGMRVTVVIRDYGIGMSDELLRDIFNPKVSTSREGTEGERGTGLGMPILKMFMDKFGGEVDVSSTTRGVNGTEFRLHFNKVLK